MTALQKLIITMDITMCKGTNCHLKEQCYRFTANRSMLQYYFATPPIKNGKCSHFWDNKNKIT